MKGEPLVEHTLTTEGRERGGRSIIILISALFFHLAPRHLRHCSASELEPAVETEEGRKERGDHYHKHTDDLPSCTVLWSEP